MDARSRRARFVADTVAEAVEGIEHGQPPAPTIAVRLGEAIHADFTTYGRVDLDSGECRLETRPDVLDSDLMIQATLDIPHSHPVLDYWLAGHTGVAAVSSLVPDRLAWRGSAGYSLLKTHFGCTESGGIRLDQGRRSLHVIGFARHRDFTYDEMALFGDLRQPAIALSRHAAWLDTLDRRPADHDDPRSRAASLHITTRELEVLHLLATGLLASTIAARLSISPRTVHRHLGHIYAKLDTHDRLTAVIRAQQAGLLAGQREEQSPRSPALTA